MRENNKKLAPNGKQNKISRQIRRDIRSGVYAPGEKLPLRIEIEKKYNASPVTVQKAFDKLKEDKYIYSTRAKGTFVANTLPCFTNYAIVFPQHSAELLKRVDLYSELFSMTEEFGVGDFSFTIYTGLNGHIMNLII